jgi:hypothetical protein
MDQKFGNAIAEHIFKNLSFDFDVFDINARIERLKFYDSILEEIVNEKFRENSFIAGGGFLIKYNQKCSKSTKNPTEYHNFSKNSKMNVFIKIKNSTKYKVNGRSQKINLERAKRDYLTENYTYEENFEENAYYITKIHKNIPIRICIQFTVYNLFALLNTWNFEPGKIGYKYKGELYFSRWYLTGGRMYKQDDTDENLANIVKKYKYKNINRKMHKLIANDLKNHINPRSYRNNNDENRSENVNTQARRGRNPSESDSGRNPAQSNSGRIHTQSNSGRILTQCNSGSNNAESRSGTNPAHSSSERNPSESDSGRNPAQMSSGRIHTQSNMGRNNAERSSKRNPAQISSERKEILQKMIVEENPHKVIVGEFLHNVITTAKVVMVV